MQAAESDDMQAARRDPAQPTARHDGAASDLAGLAALEREVRRDLQRLNFPAAEWVPPTPGPDRTRALDALVVGAGMCGQTAAFALQREGVRHLRVIDRSAAGAEGPWGTFARMETLRSPKHLTGPDLGVPSLTFRAWYEAQHGEAGWQSLYKIARLDWLEYLLWVRRAVGLRVDSGVELVALEPHDGWLRAKLRSPAGLETVHARKVVLALGREGGGAVRWPRFASFDPHAARRPPGVFHSADAIDFTSLAGQRVAVLGVGASAFDNAAAALEFGAAEVVMFARRAHLPQINKSKWASFAGFQRGLVALDDARRWRFITYILDEQVPPPHESVLRCDRHANFSIRFAEPWTDLQPVAGGVRVVTPRSAQRFDAAVVATGFDVDLAARPELAALRDAIQLWGDRLPASVVANNAQAARFPYLGAGFELRERAPGQCPVLRDVHLFNWGATVSHGQLAGDIPGLGVGATRLAQAIASDLFVADADRHWDALVAHDDAELAPTRYFMPRGGPPTAG